MARLRTIKSEFWTSEQIVNCSRDARLLFIGLWNFSDDAGIHPASSLRLKMEVFPNDKCSDDEIRKWISELITNELMYEYEAEGKHYWQVSGWHRHQRIDRPTYRYPAHNKINDLDQKNLTSSNINQQDFDEQSTNAQRELIDESLRSRTEQNRVEEKDICKVSDETSPIDDNKNFVNQPAIELFRYW